MAGVVEFKCKNCGANLDVRKSDQGVLVCEYCGTTYTLPKKETMSKVLMLLGEAERNLDTRHFDDAYTLYRKAAEEDSSEPEAYFGMALATAQVQYLRDYRANGRQKTDPPEYRMQPICYDISFDATQWKFSDDKNFRRALELATPAQRKVYLEKGEEIDRIRSEFFALKKSGLSYDCFICVKVSSEDKKGHTEDALTATKLYHELKKAGYSPFFSEEEMKERSGARYEALILYALYCADCMLIVCSDESYLQTPWVKNEYSRYIKMLGEAEKQRESITIAFQGTPIEKLPGLPWKIQGIDLGVMDGLSRVLRFVDQFASAKAALPEIKRKDYSGIAVQKRTSLKQDIQKRKIEIIKGGTVTVSDQVKLGNAEEFMRRGDFDRAMRFCMEVIRENPSTGRAYWLLFLAENGCRDADAMVHSTTPVVGYDNFERALSATENAKERNEYYIVLSERIKEVRDLNTYSEFIALPEVTESWIASLTEDMFATAKETKDEQMFSVLIKTVTDTDRYIAMNAEFAHLFSDAKQAVRYYRNILNVDAGHAEALYKCFIVDKGLLAEAAAFEYYAAPANRSAVERGLFAYGFNGYAMEKLVALVCKNAGRQREKASALFDFLLSLIPEKSDKLFKQYLNDFIKALFEAKDHEKARKYVDLLLSIDEYDDNAYFYRCMIEKKCCAPLGLAVYAEANALLDDENFMSAYNAYSVKHPHEENFYLKLNDALVGIAPLLQAPECLRFALQKFHLEKEEILTCKKSIQNALDEMAYAYWGSVKERYHVTDFESTFTLCEDITGDINLRLAKIFAQSENIKQWIDKIYNEQPEEARKNERARLLRKAQMKKELTREKRLDHLFIALVGSAIVLLVFGIAGVSLAYTGVWSFWSLWAIEALVLESGLVLPMVFFAAVCGGATIVAFIVDFVQVGRVWRIVVSIVTIGITMSFIISAIVCNIRVASGGDEGEYYKDNGVWYEISEHLDEETNEVVGYTIEGVLFINRYQETLKIPSEIYGKPLEEFSFKYRTVRGNISDGYQIDQIVLPKSFKDTNVRTSRYDQLLSTKAFYEGAPEDYEATNVKIWQEFYYYSETTPTEEQWSQTSNWWHYENGEIAIWTN